MEVKIMDREPKRTIKWVQCIDCGAVVPIVAGAVFVPARNIVDGWRCMVCIDFDILDPS
jgi:hypothetical protein